MIIHEVNESNYIEERKKGKTILLEKFKQVDKLKEMFIPKDEYKAKMSYIWRDPTCWAYSMLRDKENKKLVPYYFQDMIMNDSHRFIHVTAANQIGKTWSMIIKAFHHAWFVNNSSVMLISRSEDNAKYILDELKWMGRRAKVNFSVFEDEVTNRYEYHLKSPDKIGTSVIRVFPPTKKILGFPATLIILDETGFWELKEVDMTDIELYQQVIEPRTNTTKNWKHPFLTMGQIVSISNPNGQSGLAWWFYNNSRWHNYVYNWLAKPGNEIEEYKAKQEELPPIRFASIYAAEYMLAKGGFIELEQYERFAKYNSDFVIQPGILYLGADFASEDPKTKHTDSSVIYGVVHEPNKRHPQNPRIRLVYRKSFPPKTKREIIYAEINRIKNLPGVHIGKFAYDKVGVGDAVKSDLINRGILVERQIEPLTYSLPNKSEVFLNFQNLFQQDMIEGKDIYDLKLQILGLRVEQPRGSIHIKVHHKTEGTKDDEPDALANACWAAKASGGAYDCNLVGPTVKEDKTNVGKMIKSNMDFEDWIDQNKIVSYI